MTRFTTAIATAMLCAATLASAVTAPMPYRPGYGLGSWLPPAVVDSLRQEANARGELSLLEGMDADAASLAREIQLAAAPANPLSAVQTIDSALSAEKARHMANRVHAAREKIWERKVGAYMDLLEHLEGSVASTKKDAAGRARAATSFVSGVESAVDWGASQVTYVDRGFDSITVDATFVKALDVEQDGSGSSHARNIGRALSNQSKSITGLDQSMLREVAQMVGERAQRTASTQAIEGTMLLTAFATHRQVKSLQPLVVSTDKLWGAWNYYHPSDAIANPVSELDAFTAQLKAAGGAAPGNATTIDLVTEVFLGSTFVGMAHVLQTRAAKANSSQELSADALFFNDTSSQMLNQMSDAQTLASRTGNVQLATSKARTLMRRAESAGLNVAFDVVCLGFMPQVQSSAVQTAVQQFRNFDPASFAVSNVIDKTPAGASYVQTVQQSNMQSVIEATVLALGDVDASAPVLSEQSFMTAFGDYVSHSQQAGASAPVGAPIGMNVKRFTKLDVMSQLARKYLNTHEIGTAATAASRAGTLS